MHPIYAGLPDRQIACVDMRSFYASCAAALEGLDVMSDMIAVVGNLEQRGSIVLAASPTLKKRFGVKTGTRLFEIPKHPNIYLIEPKMATYLKMSMEIPKLLNKYVPTEAIHVYSVDECFFDLSGTEKLWGPIERTIERIQYDLYNQLQLPSAVGVGPNMLMSKLALDIEAKKTGVARWTYEDVPTKLWPVNPLSEMWGIGRKTEKSLNDMGIFCVGDLAHASLDVLEKKFGIMGNQLYHHAWGIDLSKVDAPMPTVQVSYGKSQILMRDYNSIAEVRAVLLEMCEDVAKRARDVGKAGRTITLGIGYSKNAFGGGFQRSRTINEATNETMAIYAVCKELLSENYDARPVRQVSLSITKLENEQSVQLSLFEKDNWRGKAIGTVMDSIRNKYGSTAILRAISLTDAGTAIKRSALVGGHKG